MDKIKAVKTDSHIMMEGRVDAAHLRKTLAEKFPTMPPLCIDAAISFLANAASASTAYPALARCMDPRLAPTLDGVFEAMLGNSARLMQDTAKHFGVPDAEVESLMEAGEAIMRTALSEGIQQLAHISDEINESPKTLN